MPQIQPYLYNQATKRRYELVTKIVYVLTNDPKERCELVSSVFAQALTALSFDYECELFVMDSAVNLVKKGYTDGLKAPEFAPIAELMKDYQEMGGKLYACHPATDARCLHKEDCIDGLEYVNASKLLESAKMANAVFTY
jgi:predicted peroxiredoxin